MKKPERVFAYFMLAGSLALAVPAGAEPGMDGIPPRCGTPMGPAGMPGMMDGMPPPFPRGLNLSEAQRDRIYAILHAQAPAMRDQAKAIHKSQTELRQLGLSDEYSDTKAQTLAEASAQAMARMAQLHARADNQIYRILTAEQRRQLEGFKAGRQRMEMP